jgi:hypothetical protein
MRIIITVALLFIFSAVSGQRIVPIGGNRTTDTGLIVGSLKVDSVLVFPAYRGANENLVLGFDSRGKAVLRINNDSLIYATRRYVDSVANAITAGAVDTNNYIASITRLNTEIDSIANIIDSNNTIIYGSISALYDTLPNYVDTSQLNDSLALKQNYSDTATVDATRYWVSTQIPSLAGYVPYTGATTNVNLGSKSLTTNKVLADTLGAKSSMGIHLHGTGGTGIMVGAGGGGNITFDDYPTTVVGDSVLSTNSSGGVLRYDMKGKLANYLLRSDTSTISNRINLKLNITDTANIRLRAVAGTNMTITGTYPNLTFNATGGGGGSPTTATNTQVLYKSGTDTLKGANVVIDSTDGRLVFPYNSDTSQVGKSYIGGTKMFVRNTTAMSEIMIVDTTSIPSALQRSLNAQLYSEATPNVQVAGALTQTGAFFSASTSLRTIRGTYTLAPQTYNATNTQSNYARAVLSTSAAANQSVLIRTGGLTVTPVGIICNTSQYGRGGGRGTLTFSLPAYNAGEFFYYGYTTYVSDVASTPSTLFASLASIGIGKDDVDTTLQFMYSSSFPTGVQKVSTGVTPNSEDVYRITVYVSPISEYYLQLEVINNNSPTVTKTFKVSASNPNKPNQPKLVPILTVGNLSTLVSVSVGLIKLTEEIY